MDRFTIVYYCLALLGLLLLQGVISVEGRSIFNSRNHVFNPNEDTQGKILELLLQKSLVSIKKENPMGMDLASKFAELKELQALTQELDLERKLENIIEGKSITRKRSEPCFWKYCV